MKLIGRALGFESVKVAIVTGEAMYPIGFVGVGEIAVLEATLTTSLTICCEPRLSDT